MSDTSNIGDFLRGMNITPEDMQKAMQSNRNYRPFKMVHLEMSMKEAFLRLLAKYQRKVQQRGRQLLLDDNVKSVIAQVAQEMTKPYPKQGFWFIGMRGNGKTTIAKALYELIVEESSKTEYGYDLQYFKHDSMQVTATELSNIYRCDDLKKLNAYVNAPMLLIDDLGEEPKEILVYGTPVYPLREILESRYSALNFTILTSNLTPEDLKNHYGPRIVDRINEMFVRVVHKGNSYRRIEDNG